MCVYKGLVILQKGAGRHTEGQCSGRGCEKASMCGRSKSVSGEVCF